MANVMRNAHLDNESFIAELKALKCSDLIRLRKKSAYRALGTGMEGNDLLNEAICRTLEKDGRNCPANVPIGVYLDNAMRSIADSEREKYIRQVPVGDWDEENSEVNKSMDNNLSSDDAVLDSIELEQIVDRIQDIFADDPQAQAIVIGVMEGWSPKEIKEMEPMDDKQYASARRRVRRALDREFGRRD